MKIYLAGPEVFFPNPFEIAQRKKQICDRYGHTGVFPMDAPLPNDFGDMEPLQQSYTIYTINRTTMMGCDAVIANMTPFRGVSMDCGTSFEMGFMAASGKPILGYSNNTLPYNYRVRKAFSPVTVDEKGLHRDCDGMQIEDFNLADNLMMEGAINHSLYVMQTHDADVENIWTDLTAFEKCVSML
jgi:nucleoside 2-deoxyribosyltransferase